MIKSTRALLVQHLQDTNVREKLMEMQQDPKLAIQASSFSPDSEQYPDGQIPFVDKHIAYLMKYPKLDPDQYLANLRLMLRKR